MFLFATLPLIAPPEPTWVRVDDPDHPDAVARSETGAVLEAPPPAGTPWRWESVPEVDGTLVGGGNEALGATNAGSWHDAGHTGDGVVVAVFDVGWSSDAVDLAAFDGVATHDCVVSRTCEVPFEPTELPSAPGAGPHGWGCAEVVHAVAPDAELHLVRVGGLTTFENAVSWAIRNDVDIISMSMSFYNDSFYDGTGPHAPLIEALDRADILFVTSAGNSGAQHWSGVLDGPHGNAVDLVLDRDTAVYLAWDQFDRCGVTDLDAVIVDGSGLVIASGVDEQWPTADRCEPVERLRATVDERQEVRLEIRHRRGPREALPVSVITRGGVVVSPTPGSTTDPAVHPRAVAVGAVPVGDYFGGPVERFSSRGITPSGVVKPDITGPDRLSTRAFGPGGFAGTSASTPAVAGLVALIRSRDPSLSNREAYNTLEAWAHSDPLQPDAPPHGAGRARLPRLDAPTSCTTAPPSLAIGLWLLALLGVRRKSHG